MAKKPRTRPSRVNLKTGKGMTKCRPIVILDDETLKLVQAFQEREFIGTLSNAGRILIRRGAV